MMFPIIFRRCLGVSVVILLLVLSSENILAQGAPLATTELKSVAPGVKIEILTFKRTSGGTVTLEFAMVNETDEKVSVVKKYFALVHRSDVGKITLVDYKNKKRYLVIRDADNKCLCTNGNYEDHRLDPNSRKEFWIKFPAPPQDVTTIWIDIPGALPLDDVPIEN